ncbi:hydroxyacylglutathione hydrolase [Pseudoalteromonas sp. JBTF-M23]|uniref:Hydroxyacylglutathione hydrolase n=1 Tax=Pseudoalteromonas caenipelagi TaxID=2726988 RepID=A0A849VD12_9GAMM|nr:hydroxyacylglutathione hydrolase [Pseudoalteromonas caenipelagi]NOU50680.1 hydroxyacylglutathione hydrolase [Pseudoalteromonas caenipelagi]
MVQVEPIKAFTDNYIWAIRDTENNHVWVVDPGQADPVNTYLAQKQATLKGVLVTHHHWDHTNGIQELLKSSPSIAVYGPTNSPFNGITHPLKEGDELDVLSIKLRVIETPGHTLDHICYLSNTLCFTGDTIFSAGCGRLMEGSSEQMWLTLCKFNDVPDDALMYCTHEYTLANLAFASAVEPNNSDIQNYKKWAEQQVSKCTPTLPSTFAKERAVNPFLRATLTQAKANIPHHLSDDLSEPWKVFAALRAWKDSF